jgi:aryl-alcohol dehydrogenase-like predicted oxidoreductase
VADQELDSYLAALSGGDEEHSTELTGRFGTAQVFQLRLPALRIEQLRRIAADRGVSPGALAVDWVIERLDREDTPTGPLPVVEDEEEQPKRRGLRRLGRKAPSWPFGP